MGSERMPERVTGGPLGESGKGGGLLHGPLENRFVEVVTIQAPGTGILRIAVLREISTASATPARPLDISDPVHSEV